MGIDALRALDLPHTRIVELEMIEGDFKNEYFSTSGLRPTWRVRYETSYGEDSLIRSELWLPEAWNGRFVGIGNGGLAGVLRADYAGHPRRQIPRLTKKDRMQTIRSFLFSYAIGVFHLA